MGLNMKRSSFSKNLLLLAALFCTASLLFFANACKETTGVVDGHGAEISPLTFSIIATAGLCGTIEHSSTVNATVCQGGVIEPCGTVIVKEGGNISFSITPLDQYAIMHILVDDVPVVPANEYMFTNVRENHKIHVTFTNGDSGDNGE